MAYAPKTLQVSRDRFIELVTLGISNGKIDDYTPEEVMNMTATKLAYMFLRHSTMYFNDFGPDPEDAEAIQAWNLRFYRLQRLMHHIHEHPPIKEHIKFLKRMNTIVLSDYSVARRLREPYNTVNTLWHNFKGYQTDIAALAIRVTQTERKLTQYLSNRQRFYWSPRTDDYDADDFDSTDYKSYLRELTTFKAYVKNTAPHPVWLKLLLSHHLWNAQVEPIDSLGLPIIVNPFPITIQQEWISDDDYYSANADPIPDRTDPPASFYNGTEDTCYLRKYFYDDDEMMNVTIEGAPSRNPFAGFGFPPPHGHPHGGSHGHPPPHHSTDEASTSGSGVPPPPPPPPPPATPAMPDDTNYSPPGMLSAKARAFTAIAISKIGDELYHDHMTRFSTTDESPRSLSRSEVIPGGTSAIADIKIQTRIRDVTTIYVITYTRKSRKPIFNVVN